MRGGRAFGVVFYLELNMTQLSDSVNPLDYSKSRAGTVIRLCPGPALCSDPSGKASEGGGYFALFFKPIGQNPNRTLSNHQKKIRMFSMYRSENPRHKVL